MKTYFKLITLITLPVFLSGCVNQYISGNQIGGDEYYGALMSRDLVQSDVQLFNINNRQKCAGTVFMDSVKNAVKDEKGVKWVDAQSNISCDDGTVLDLNWKAHTINNWSGEGYDQFGKRYEFRVITKKQFRQIAGDYKIKKSSYIEAVNELVKY